MLEFKMLTSIFIFLFIAKLCESIDIEAFVPYTNFTLYCATPTTAKDLKFLQNLKSDSNKNVKFWKKSFRLYHDSHFIVDPVSNNEFLERARHFRIDFRVLQPNLTSTFEEYIKQSEKESDPDNFWNTYRTLEDIEDWLSKTALINEGKAELLTIGSSVQKRSIYALEIRLRPTCKHLIIVEAGIHGNEWISPAFATYLINALLNAHESNDENFKTIATEFAWYIIPVLNPDGYYYTHTKDRLWRKNLRPLNGALGVDLNRNFDYNFGKFESSPVEGEENYHGPHAYSEPESRALRELLIKKHRRLKYYFSIHAYGEIIIIPYSNNVKHVENFDELQSIGLQAAAKIYRNYNKRYKVGTYFDTLGYRISGDTASWVKKKFETRYVYTLQLGDNGTYGYALPPSKILPVCEETLVAMKTLIIAKPRRVTPRLINLIDDMDDIASRVQGNSILVLCLAFLLK